MSALASRLPLARMALAEAEHLLDSLPQTSPVRALYEKMLPLKTVLVGCLHGSPRLSRPQENHVADAVMQVAREILTLHESATAAEERAPSSISGIRTLGPVDELPAASAKKPA